MKSHLKLTREGLGMTVLLVSLNFCPGPAPVWSLHVTSYKYLTGTIICEWWYRVKRVIPFLTGFLLLVDMKGPHVLDFLQLRCTWRTSRALEVKPRWHHDTEVGMLVPKVNFADLTLTCKAIHHYHFFYQNGKQANNANSLESSTLWGQGSFKLWPSSVILSCCVDEHGLQRKDGQLPA